MYQEIGQWVFKIPAISAMNDKDHSIAIEGHWVVIPNDVYFQLKQIIVGEKQCQAMENQYDTSRTKVKSRQRRTNSVVSQKTKTQFFGGR